VAIIVEGRAASCAVREFVTADDVAPIISRALQFRPFFNAGWKSDGEPTDRIRPRHGNTPAGLRSENLSLNDCIGKLS
jgi:hypothetical protein